MAYLLHHRRYWVSSELHFQMQANNINYVSGFRTLDYTTELESLLEHILRGPPPRVSDSVDLGTHPENPPIPGKLGGKAVGKANRFIQVEREDASSRPVLFKLECAYESPGDL